MDLRLHKRDFLKLLGGAGAAMAGTGLLARAEAFAQATGKTALSIAIAQEIQGTFPFDLGTATTSTFAQVYDALTERDAEGAVVPGAAESWEVQPDSSWIFKIRQGISFTNGEPLDAHCVKFTFDQMAAPDNKWGNRADQVSVIERIETLDDHTVQIFTKVPFGTLPLRLILFRILPRQYYTEHGEDYVRANPVGSGPYKFVAFTPGESYQMVSNPDYWRGAPKITDLTFRVIPDASARVLALQAGDVDLIDDVPINEMKRLTAEGRFVTASAPSTFCFFGQFNTYKDSPLRDVRVRKAINMAVDVDTIIEVILEGYAVKLNTVAYNQSFDNYDPAIERDPYDVEAARALLAEAGQSAGFDLSLVINPAQSGMGEVAQVIAAQLGEIGIRVTVMEKEAGLQREQYKTHDVGDIVLMRLGGYHGDGGVVTNLAFAPGTRYSLWEDPGLDKVRAEMEAATDPAEQKRLNTALQQQLKDEVPGIVLWQAFINYAHVDTLKGWQAAATSVITVRDAYFD